MSKSDKDDKAGTEHDLTAMQVAVNEILDALKPLNAEAQLRVLASVATFLNHSYQLQRRLSS